jgi:hypothetical protein
MIADNELKEEEKLLKENENQVKKETSVVQPGLKVKKKNDFKK